MEGKTSHVILQDQTRPLNTFYSICDEKRFRIEAERRVLSFRFKFSKSTKAKKSVDGGLVL